MALQGRVTAAVLVLGFAAPRLSVAQDTTKADETFHAGRELMKDGKLAEACPKFEESQRADPASGTLLALAYCQELSGLLASAHSNYLAASALAAKEGQSERQKAAGERAESLAKRYSTLTILVPAELSRQAGLKILRDGIEVDRTAYNVRIPLNGGTHAIEVSAPGRERWSGVLVLQTEADHKTLQLPVLQPAASSYLELTPPRPPGRTPAPTAVESASVRRMRHASIGLGLGAAVATGVGITFGLAAKSRNDASNRDGHCSERGCDAYGADRRNAALDAAHISTWSFVAAGALGVGAVVLYFKAESSASTSTQLATSLIGGSPHVSLSGSF